MGRTGSLHDFYAALTHLQYTAPFGVWPAPGKIPRENVDRAILITIHHESAFGTLIGPLPQGHVLEVPTPTAHLGRIPFIENHQCFPVQLAFIGEHLYEGVQAPIVIHGPIQMLLALGMLAHHHLSLGKIADHNSSLNQFVGDEMGSLMQAIALRGSRFFSETRL
jgi:hypothetical protein